MRDYPPEYDELFAVEVKPLGDLTYPDYVDGVYWDEYGRVFFIRKDREGEETIIENYGEDIDLADESAVMEQLKAHVHTYFEVPNMGKETKTDHVMEFIDQEIGKLPGKKTNNLMIQLASESGGYRGMIIHILGHLDEEAIQRIFPQYIGEKHETFN